MTEAPLHAKTGSKAMQGPESASALDEETAAPSCLTVLAAPRTWRAPHPRVPHQAGATRGEVIRAVSVGGPAAGNGVTKAIRSRDAAQGKARALAWVRKLVTGVRHDHPEGNRRSRNRPGGTPVPSSSEQGGSARQMIRRVEKSSVAVCPMRFEKGSARPSVWYQ